MKKKQFIVVGVGRFGLSVIETLSRQGVEVLAIERNEEKLEQIAMTYSIEIMERGGLDTRDNDREDFPEISIWGIREMLEKAYQLGLEDGAKQV